MQAISSDAIRGNPAPMTAPAPSVGAGLFADLLRNFLDSPASQRVQAPPSPRVEAPQRSTPPSRTPADAPRETAPDSLDEVDAEARADPANDAPAPIERDRARSPSPDDNGRDGTAILADGAEPDPDGIAQPAPAVAIPVVPIAAPRIAAKADGPTDQLVAASPALPADAGAETPVPTQTGAATPGDGGVATDPIPDAALASAALAAGGAPLPGTGAKPAPATRPAPTSRAGIAPAGPTPASDAAVVAAGAGAPTTAPIATPVSGAAATAQPDPLAVATTTLDSLADPAESAPNPRGAATTTAQAAGAPPTAPGFAAAVAAQQVQADMPAAAVAGTAPVLDGDAPQTDGLSTAVPTGPAAGSNDATADSDAGSQPGQARIAPAAPGGATPVPAPNAQVALATAAAAEAPSAADAPNAGGARLEPAVAAFGRGGTGSTGGTAAGASATAGLAAKTAAAQPIEQQVALHVQKAVRDGVDRIRIQLTPQDLGRVEVRLEFHDDGKFHARISAERSETLDLLQRDVRSLERALQDAGVKTDSGSLSFDFRGRGQQDGPAQGTRPAALVPDAAGDAAADATDASSLAPRYGTSNRALDIQV